MLQSSSSGFMCSMAHRAGPKPFEEEVEARVLVAHRRRELRLQRDEPAVLVCSATVTAAHATRSANVAEDPPAEGVWHMHTNAALFPESMRFNQNSWLGQPTVNAGADPLVAGGVRLQKTRPLSHYMKAFSGGTRGNFGAVISITFATLFRRHELRLHHSTYFQRDVKVHMGKFLARPKHDSKTSFKELPVVVLHLPGVVVYDGMEYIHSLDVQVVPVGAQVLGKANMLMLHWEKFHLPKRHGQQIDGHSTIPSYLIPF
ncbi:hypothetical protein B0H63DRAFT_455632 [Podospora didyma]|uniref:Uncharacterized protein n=1 Tax=Podospora didyma TaxID=330526 RepID=A0AAE0N1L7_9PEZI|nr:hypothetical protein B0H63DRAFT_455632 [Podospora didyma]